MPNGGTTICSYCCNFDTENSTCKLRKVWIDKPFWTYCHNFNRKNIPIIGELFSIVCEVIDHRESYYNIPYYRNIRVETWQEGSSDTYLSLVDENGKKHTFDTVKEYLDFYDNQKIKIIKENQLISREKAKTIGHETLKIFNDGGYQNSSGEIIKLDEMLQESTTFTVTYNPDAKLSGIGKPKYNCSVKVENTTTLEGVIKLVARGFNPVALNFASAISPGGGFLNGARAQEEYLARSSGLWFCLKNNPMYEYHIKKSNPLFSDYIIYSPSVPVIRDDRGNLLDFPYKCSIITSPAVYADAVMQYIPERKNEIIPAMKQRLLKVMTIAEEKGHDSLILGAWGCGAFGNDVEEIAKIFFDVINNEFKNTFRSILFAIADWSEDQRFIGPFRSIFN